MTNSNEPLPSSCVACTNKFTLCPLEELSQRICPFCRNVVWPTSANSPTEPLSELGDFEVVRRVEWEARAVVFEAIREGERFLITLLDSGDLLYTSAKAYRDVRQDYPPNTIKNSPHPNFLEFHPIQWAGDVAFAAIEYIDGKTLLDWLIEVGPINVQDAVSIVLACARFVHHVDGNSRAREINLKTIHITQNGEIKITAFGGPMFIPFELTPEQQMRRDHRSRESHRSSRSKKRRRIGMVLYNPPKATEKKSHSDQTDEETRLESIYCLGCLLFELATDQPIPMISIGMDSIRTLELVPVHEIQPTAPAELSTIINRMAAFDPSQRYQDFETLIVDLEALNLDSPKVSFVTRTGPPVDQQAIQDEHDRQWVRLTDDFDFRKVKWGMTQDEVRKAEPTNPNLVMPGCMMFDTSYHDLDLLLVYKFAEDEGNVFCIGVSLQQNLHQGYVRRESPSADPDGGLSDLFSIEEEIRQFRRDATPEEGLKRQQDLYEEMKLQHKKSSIADLERETNDRLNSGTLDKNAANATYEKFKELIVSDYGEPELIDGQLNEDPAFIQALVDQNDSDKPQDLGDCKSTYWRTESTNVVLSIGPQPFGDRAISATFASIKHGRFIPGHPDFKPNRSR